MKGAFQALHEATLLIAERGELNDVLQHIVDAARELLQAQYSALGVPNEAGLLDAFIHSGIPTELARKMDHLPHGRGLLGAIIHEQVPIRVPKIGDDPRSIGFPAHHPPMDSFLGVPIIGEGGVVGNLYFCDKLGQDEFTTEDEELAVMFAAHAAIAIQNARLDEEVQRLAVLEERSRIGMDLHDGIIQSIYAVGLTLESVKIASGEPSPEVGQLLDIAIEGLNDAIRDIRNFILDLRPHRYDGDLAKGIHRLAREFQANTMAAIEVSLPERPVVNLPPHIGRTIFLTAQNGLANVARHAKASQVWLTIELNEEEISVEIRDDGLGFDPKGREDAVGHGLHNMRTRAERLEGSFSLATAPNQGTAIRMSIPLS